MLHFAMEADENDLIPLLKKIIALNPNIKILGSSWSAPVWMLLNIAVGGEWGGQKGIDDSIFPQKMLVDYVRVYQKI